MTKMKRIFCIALLLPLFFSTHAIAQMEYGFACADDGGVQGEVMDATEISQGSKWITLGNPKEDNCEECQYTWKLITTYDWSRVEFGEGWPHAKNPRIRLGIGITTLMVTRASKYGLQAEYVNVDVGNRIQVRATPKDGRCCWSSGAPINMDEFDIETDPPGFLHFVELAEDSRQAYSVVGGGDIFGGGGDSEQIVRFVAKPECPYEVVGSVRINVIETENFLDFGVAYGKSISEAFKMYNELKSIEKMKDKFDHVEKAAKALKKFGMPFEWSWDIGAELNINLGRECCCGEERYHLNINGDTYISGSIMGHFPIPPIPPAVTADVGLTGKMSLVLDDFVMTFNGDSECSCTGNTVLPIVINGEISLGVSLSGPIRDLMSVGAAGVGGLTIKYNIFSSTCLWDLFDYDFYCKLKVYGNIGFGRVSWEYYLAD